MGSVLLPRKIKFEEIKEYDVIRFSVEKSCGSMKKKYVATVIKDKEECLIAVHTDTKSLFNVIGSYPYMELEWIKDNLLDGTSIELVHRY